LLYRDKKVVGVFVRFVRRFTSTLPQEDAIDDVCHHPGGTVHSEDCICFIGAAAFGSHHVAKLDTSIPFVCRTRIHPQRIKVLLPRLSPTLWW
jgi:hypothetical protein